MIRAFRDAGNPTRLRPLVLATLVTVLAPGWSASRSERWRIARPHDGGIVPVTILVTMLADR